MAITIEEGHELEPFEALLVIVGLFFTFTIVKLKGPNKRNNNNNHSLKWRRRHLLFASKYLKFKIPLDTSYFNYYSQVL